VQALIEAGRHVGEADRQMLSAIEELQAAAVASSLTKLEPEGPVPTAQTAATEALVRALTALNPPQDEQQQDQDEQQQDSEQQQEQQPQPRQDIRRAMEQLDQEREQAERQLYRDRPSSTGKNW
jgi:DNA polymerase III delta prime subunit